MTEADRLRRDAERWQWLERNGRLGFDGAPYWGAVLRVPVASSDDQTLAEVVDRALLEEGDQ